MDKLLPVITYVTADINHRSRTILSFEVNKTSALHVNRFETPSLNESESFTVSTIRHFVKKQHTFYRLLLTLDYGDRLPYKSLWINYYYWNDNVSVQVRWYKPRVYYS